MGGHGLMGGNWMGGHGTSGDMVEKSRALPVGHAANKRSYWLSPLDTIVLAMGGHTLIIIKSGDGITLRSIIIANCYSAEIL